MIVVREAPELDEAVLDRDLRYRSRCRIAVPQDRMNRAEPLVTQIRDRSQTEHVIKGAMQRPSRHVQLRAYLGHVDGSNARGFEIIVDLADQLHRRGERPSGVRW